MGDILKRDEGVLSDSEKIFLNTTLEKMEQYFPEHKVFAFDALCSQHRKTSLSFSKKLGYESVEAFLNAYGFELISGEAVYEIRKDCGIKPGEEPSLLKARIDNAINSLDLFYPDHIVSKSINKEHKGLYMNLTGYWQWLGYRSLEDMLDAYGFSLSSQGHTQNVSKSENKGGRPAIDVNVSKSESKGGRPAIDVTAIVEELVSRYGGDRFATSVEQLKEENPDLAANIKSLQNRSKELFGVTLNNYLKEKGVFQSDESAAASRQADIKEKLTLIIDELKKRYETKELPTSLAALKDDNKDIEGINNINTWTVNLYGKKALAYLTEIGLVKEKIKVEVRNEPKRTRKVAPEKPQVPAEPLILEFTSSEEVEAFCREFFVPGLLSQFAKKIGIKETAFRGVKYKTFNK